MFPAFQRCAAAASACILLFSMPAESANAQGEIRGTIVSAETGEPLDGAQIYISRLRRGTTTDAEGRYTLSSLDPGIYEIEFSYLGYARRLQTVRIEADRSLLLDAVLVRETLETREVVIVADNPRQIASIPLSTLTVSESDRLDRGSLSLWEDLDAFPGMARSTNGPGIERPLIRGLSGGRVLLLMQQLPYGYQTWDPEAGLASSGNDAEQVDVIQGPSTLRYGPGAMGGVISFTPEYPATVGRTEGSFSGLLTTNTGGLTGNLALKQSMPGWFWGAGAGYNSHADYKAGGDYEIEGRTVTNEEEKGKIPNSRFDLAQASVFTGLSRNWGSTRLSYKYFRHRNGIVEAEEEEVAGEKENEREIKPPFHSLQDHILTSDTQIRIGPGWMHGILGVQINNQQEFEPANEAGIATAAEPEGEAAIDLRLTTLHFRLDYEAALSEKTSATGGLQGSHQENESEGLEPFVPNADINQVGAFGLLNWEAGALAVEAGVRYDAESLETSPAMGEEEPPGTGTGGEEAEIKRAFGLLSGSIGGTYTAGPGRFFKMNFGAGNRAPDVAELTADGLLREVRRYLIGDADLRAENNVEVDVSLDWRFETVTFTVGGFYERIFDYIYLFASGEFMDEYPTYLYRQGDTVFRGGHAGLTVHPPALERLRIFGRFDLVEAELSDSPGYALPMIPAPHLLSGVEYGTDTFGPFHDGRVRAEVDGYLKQDRTPPWETASNGYTLVNLSVVGRLPWHGRMVRLGLHGRNILDTQYVSHVSLLKQDGIPDLGRAVTFTFQVPFGW